MSCAWYCWSVLANGASYCITCTVPPALMLGIPFHCTYVRGLAEPPSSPPTNIALPIDSEAADVGGSSTVIALCQFWHSEATFIIACVSKESTGQSNADSVMFFLTNLVLIFRGANGPCLWAFKLVPGNRHKCHLVQLLNTDLKVRTGTFVLRSAGADVKSYIWAEPQGTVGARVVSKGLGGNMATLLRKGWHSILFSDETGMGAGAHTRNIMSKLKSFTLQIL